MLDPRLLYTFNPTLWDDLRGRRPVLVHLLEGFRTHSDPRLLVGYDRSDDASVYYLDENTALVQTTDFFPPIVDDPFLYGQIAAANAISDVYAMGGEPKLALNILCLPESMPREMVQEPLVHLQTGGARHGVLFAHLVERDGREGDLAAEREDDGAVRAAEGGVVQEA